MGIVVNGCENACVNVILKERSADAVGTIDITYDWKRKMFKQEKHHVLMVMVKSVLILLKTG